MKLNSVGKAVESATEDQKINRLNIGGGGLGKLIMKIDGVQYHFDGRISRKIKENELLMKTKLVLHLILLISIFTTPNSKNHFELSYKSGNEDYLVGIEY